MPRIVEFDGVEHEFPDGATDEQVRRALLVFSRNKKTDALKQKFAEPQDAGFLAGLGEALNPMNIVRGVGAAVTSPVETAKALWNAQAEQFAKAKLAAQQGRMSEAGGYALAGALPLVGPAAANAGEMIGEGRPGEGLGQAVGMIAAGPLMRGAVRGVQALRTPTIQPANTLSGASARWGRAQGAPLSPAQMSDSGIVQATATRAANTMLGSGAADAAKESLSNWLQTKGAGFVDDAMPGAANTPLTAGERAVSSLKGKVDNWTSLADREYDALRAIEESKPMQVVTGYRQVPMNGTTVNVPIAETINMPVDIRGVKTALKPIHDSMKRTLTIRQQEASPGFHAIQQLMSAPDYLPASAADQSLGTIKGLSRLGDTEARTISKGLAAKAVQELQKAVDESVANIGGPNAIDALRRGRAATVKRWEAQTLLSEIAPNNFEPVKVFEKLTQNRDAAIRKLAKLEKIAPDAIPPVRQAVLQGMMENLGDAGTKGAKALMNQWRSLGMSTKKLLFGENLNDLENFFTLNERVARDFNPSGSGKLVTSALEASTTGALAGSGSLLAAAGIPLTNWALSKLLNTPSGAKLLVDGLRFGTKTKRGIEATGKLARIAATEGLLEAQAESQLAPVEMIPSESIARGISR